VLHPFRAHHLAGYWGDWTREFQEKEGFMEKLLDVNVLGYTHTAMAMLPHLNDIDGQLVVVSSGVAKIASPKTAPYAATKGAVQAFFESIRQDLILRGSNLSITLCVLGNVASENAKANTNGAIDHLGWSSVDDAAHVIMAGGALKRHTVYFPYTELSAMISLRVVAPTFADWLTRVVITGGRTN